MTPWRHSSLRWRWSFGDWQRSSTTARSLPSPTVRREKGRRLHRRELQRRLRVESRSTYNNNNNHQDSRVTGAGLNHTEFHRCALQSALSVDFVPVQIISRPDAIRKRDRARTRASTRVSLAIPDRVTSTPATRDLIQDTSHKATDTDGVAL